MRDVFHDDSHDEAGRGVLGRGCDGVRAGGAVRCDRFGRSVRLDRCGRFSRRARGGQTGPFRWRRPDAAVTALAASMVVSMAATLMAGAMVPAAYAADAANGGGITVAAAGERSDASVIRGLAGADPAGKTNKADKTNNTDKTGVDGPANGKDGQSGGGKGGTDTGTTDPDGGKPDPEPKPEPEPQPEPKPTQSEPKATSPFERHVPVGVGSTLADTIDVSGFPDDHTKVEGDKPHMRVRLWRWSGGANFASIKESDLFNDLNRPVGNVEPIADKHHTLIDTWTYPAVNGRITVGNGAKTADGKAVTITADEPGWYVFMWSFDGDERAKAAATRFDDLGHAHVVIKGAQKQEPRDPGPEPTPEQPAPAPNPSPNPSPDGSGGDGEGDGDGDGQPNGSGVVSGSGLPETPGGGEGGGDNGGGGTQDAADALRKLAATKYTNGNNPLAKTGVDVGVVVLIVVAALAVGAFMLAVIRRHKA